MRPLSVSTRIKVASLLTFVPRSVRWRFPSGTGADIGIADTFTIFMGRSSLAGRCYLADAAGYADRFRLTAVQRAALIALDTRAIVAMGAHPLVPFLANMQVERQRRG